MTLDEAIKHSEEVALNNEAICEHAINIGVKNQTKKCAEEHRQLAEWLKELKEKRQAIKDIRAEIEAEKIGLDEHNRNDRDIIFGLNLARHIIDRHMGEGEGRCR